VKSIAWNEVLGTLAAHRELSGDQMRAVLSHMMEGKCGDTEAAAFLMGLRMKGETSQEIAAAARVMREYMVRWDPDCDVLDTCGTGGDGTGTFNISTAAAFVVAGAGVKVVKHGNRSVSSKSGSADVLATLGINIEGTSDSARAQLERAGLAFCFAPHFHPALRHIAPVRQRLGIPTIFNCLGPLANPAGAKRQLLGVGRAELLDPMAGALAQIGTTRTYVICGRDGLDEVSLSAPTMVREVLGRQIRSFEWTEATFGLAKVSLGEIAAANANESAAMIEQVLDNKEGPATRIVIANAAAALMVAEKADNPAHGVSLAKQAIISGAAKNVLRLLRTLATN